MTSHVLYTDGSQPTANVLASGSKKVYGFGDSLMPRWLAPLAESYGWNANCFSRPSDSVADQGNDCMSISPAAGDILLHALGTNDKIINSTDSANRDNIFSKGLLGELLQLAIKEGANKVWAQSMTPTGTWGNMVSDNIYRGRYSNTNGSTLTCSVSGTAVALTSWWDAAQTGTFSVTIDGVAKGSFTCTPDGALSTGYASNIGPWGVIFSGLSAGAHTVVITTTNGAGVNYSYVGFVAGLTSGAGVGTDPKVYVANVHDFTAAANTAQGTTTARNTRYKALQTSIVNAVAAAGLNCTLLDIDAIIGDSDLDSLGVHFNNTGSLKVRDAFIAAIG